MGIVDENEETQGKEGLAHKLICAKISVSYEQCLHLGDVEAGCKKCLELRKFFKYQNDSIRLKR